MSSDLTYAEAVEVLRTLSAVDRIVLIGGQALNFWAENYAQREAALGDLGPYTSKDIDLCGPTEAIAACARALNGQAQYQNAASLCTGYVLYLDSTGDQRQLDFLSKPYGLEADPVSAMSLPVTFDQLEAKLRVMHPWHCLKSRAANVGGLEKYRTDHGVTQLRAAICCMRAFLRELLDRGEQKAVLRLSEAVFAFSRASIDVQYVRERYSLDPFDALFADDPRMPEKFRTIRYPQMRAQIEQRRGQSSPRQG